MITSTRRKMGATAAAFSLAGAALIGGTVINPEPAAAASGCGYLGKTGDTAMYNHCGSTNVEVRIDARWGHDIECVRPGLTYFPFGTNITNIYYVGGVGCSV